MLEDNNKGKKMDRALPWKTPDEEYTKITAQIRPTPQTGPRD